MDFTTRTNQTPQAPAPSHGGSRSKAEKGPLFKSLRIASIALLFSATVLVVSLLGYMVVGGPKSEARYVQDDKIQAVFLNGGQVYFGNIEDINDKYLRLTDIFYLRVNQQVQPRQGESQQNEISLVKLGCELHRPANEMLINRDQVVFWENLKTDDARNTVPGAVKAYASQFPNGQECQDAAPQQTNQNTGGNENQSE